MTDSTLPKTTQVSFPRKWWVLLAIGTGTFMSALDSSVVNAILPVIRNNFGADIAVIEWVVTVYLLVISGLLLTFGRLGDLHGHRRIYASGFALFVLGSASCGFASSAGWLIGSRGLQALGAAMLASNSPAILTGNFPDAERGRALGLQATMTYLGLTLGPSLGGWMTGLLGWRSVFYINIPVGTLALWMSLRFIPPDRLRSGAVPFDTPGALAFVAGLVTLLLGLNQGHAWGWSSWPILCLLVVAAAALAAFVAIEQRHPHPMLDLRLFRQPTLSLATASAVLNYIGIFTVIFLLPFYLIQARGLSPQQAGLILTAQPLVMALVAPISGAVSDRLGTRLPSAVGMAILTIGLLLLSRLHAGTSPTAVAMMLTVTGLGTGMFISPNNSALMGAAPPRQRGIAAGVLATARNVGMVLGVGMAGAILTTVLASRTNLPSSAGIYAAIPIAYLAAAAMTALGTLLSWGRRVPDSDPASPSRFPAT
jgi:EmrB/QacA subfamily drug resistance transporter